MLFQALPDVRVQVHDVIAEGALVAARVTYSGTHQGEFVGIAATGEHTTVNGVDLFRMEGGRQGWAGHVELLVQLDLLPGPRPPA
jgi:predicted ester cyclase